MNNRRNTTSYSWFQWKFVQMFFKSTVFTNKYLTWKYECLGIIAFQSRLICSPMCLTRINSVRPFAFVKAISWPNYTLCQLQQPAYHIFISSKILILEIKTSHRSRSRCELNQPPCSHWSLLPSSYFEERTSLLWRVPSLWNYSLAIEGTAKMPMNYFTD